MVFICGFSAPSRAQQSCDTPFEVISTLRPTTFGFPTVWDAKYGADDVITQINSGIAQEAGTVFVVGRTVTLDDFKPKEIVLAEINRRGRALQEVRYKAKDAEEPVKMISLGKDFIVMSNMRGGKGMAEKWTRLSWYDAAGKFKREKILKDAVFDYEGMGLVESVEQAGFIAILHGVNRKDPSDENGVLMRMTPQGEIVWRRAYRPGIPNAIHDITAVTDESYIAAGRIRLDDGRIAAWAMKLAYDGAVQWQRTYPRGHYSNFRHAALLPAKTAEGRSFILVGDAKPYDGGSDAAWAMEISAVGEPVWQRYYRRPDFDLHGEWVRSEDDGRIVLMMNAKPLEGQKGTGHVRILTLSPRGALIGDEGYHEGMKAVATDYNEGWNGERIFTANIEEDPNLRQTDENGEIVVVGLAEDAKAQAEGEEKPPAKPVHRGWIFIATAPDPYIDPCASQRGP